MNSYYCIINMPGVPVREIAAFQADDDACARAETTRLAEGWPGFETVALYEGERPVFILANPGLGFATEPLAPQTEAA